MVPPEEESAEKCELCSLAEAVCNGTIAAEQYARLNALLPADEDAARRYATYVRMHGLLLWRWQDAAAAAPSAHALPAIPEPPSLSEAPAPLFTGLFSPGGYLFSYSLAALIVAIGLLIGWTYRMSNARLDRQEAVHVAARNMPADVPAKSEVVSVGRVVGTVDCQWADPKTAAAADASVPLGRKYALAAGLMEISYHSGASRDSPRPLHLHRRIAVRRLPLAGPVDRQSREERGKGRGERGERENRCDSTIRNHNFEI